MAAPAPGGPDPKRATPWGIAAAGEPVAVRKSLRIILSSRFIRDQYNTMFWWKAQALVHPNSRINPFAGKSGTRNFPPLNASAAP